MTPDGGRMSTPLLSGWPKLGFPLIRTDLPTIKGVRIIPFGDRYNIELIYNYTPQDLHLDADNVMGIDLGLNNIVTTSDNIGTTPLIIKGGSGQKRKSVL